MRTPEVEVDAEISMSDITPRFFKTLKKFAPFGPGNNSPVFMVRGLKDNGWGKAVGKENQHLKLTVLSADNPSRTYDAIGFNLGKKIDMIRDGKTFMAVFTIEENEYQGRTNVQIRLKDIKPEGDTLEYGRAYPRNRRKKRTAAKCLRFSFSGAAAARAGRGLSYAVIDQFYPLVLVHKIPIVF